MELRRPRHRRSISDPTELLPSLRQALAGEGKRLRSPSHVAFDDGLRKKQSFDAVFDNAFAETNDLFEDFGDFGFGTVVEERRPAPADDDDRRSPESESYDALDSDPEYEERARPTTRRRRPTSAGSAARGASTVDMWTVEEDLTILRMVEQEGKRWSKIASMLPGRTDNGVRNRFNRMEKAQELRSSRRADAGYRCRRCGQPKRGHICAALTQGAAPRTAAELEEKAAALTALSAAKIPAFAAEPQLAAARPRSRSEPSAGSPVFDGADGGVAGGAGGVVRVADVADGAGDAEAPLSEEEEETLAQFVHESADAALDEALLDAAAPAVGGGGGGGSFDPFDEQKLDAVLHELHLSLGGPAAPAPLPRLGSSVSADDGAVEFGSISDADAAWAAAAAAAPVPTPTPSPATPITVQPVPLKTEHSPPVLSVC